MSFMVHPQPDACRALMPTPEPPPPGPPSRPMVCHMPAGHEGPHAITRRPGTLDRRWEGDARPMTAPAEDPRSGDCPVRRTVSGNRCDGPGTYYCDSDVWGSACRRYFEAARPAVDRAEPPEGLREQIARWLFERVIRRDGLAKLQWEHLEPPQRDGWLSWADAMLAGPLAAPLDAQAAVNRVETLAKEYAQRAENVADGFWKRHLWIVSQRLRRALGGPS